jgi:sulfonate transport system substrate-binding protein
MVSTGVPAMINRRTFFGTSAGAALAGFAGAPAVAQTPTEIRIGYQKNGVLVVAREQAVLEKRFAPSGIMVTWLDFPSGPPMLEAMNAGSVDFGQVGDTPPIFAQAGSAKIVYVAGQPITNGQGILVKPDAAIRTLGDLKGKRVGFTKGSSAHNVVVLALEKAGLQYSDITPVYLSPPDGAAAFARDSIDAWSVWDPYFAIGEVKGGGRVLAKASDVGKTNSFYIANRDFAVRSPQFVSAIIDVLAKSAEWAETHRDQVGELMAEVTGVDVEIQSLAAQRSSFAIGKLTDDIVTTQQAVADRFFRLGLIPKQIAVREAVWTARQS